jgi:hypothetical protein
MKRLRRIIFNGLTMLSLLLCVSTMAMWVRSYWVTDGFIRRAFDDERNSTIWTQDVLGTGRGFASLTRIVQSGRRNDGAYRRWAGGAKPLSHHVESPIYPAMHLRSPDPSFLGFKFYRSWNRQSPSYIWQFVVPLWSMLVVSALLPAARTIRWHVRERRPLIGQCPSCGYDLRATPDRCPECGMVLGKQASIANSTIVGAGSKQHYST